MHEGCEEGVSGVHECGLATNVSYHLPQRLCAYAAAAACKEGWEDTQQGMQG
jgi:hypothetical protein